ncbi:MAG: SPOR domain-containing protein [Candidatus Acidiferrales bacterium]
MLESRHLVGLFLGVVLLCAVFFTLGYVMGRTQFGGQVQAAAGLVKNSLPGASSNAASKAKENEPAAPPASSGWDFYPTKKEENKLEPAAKPSAPVPAVATKSSGSTPAATTKTVASPGPAKPAARFQPPPMTRGSIVLQVSALTRESDALAMADILQQKRFPSFVVTPTSDALYRVQVGPYADMQSAEAAKRALDREGIKAIIKR